MPALSDNEIVARTAARVRDAVGYLDSTLMRQREQAMKYYRGDPLGNEVEGRSQVVSRDVAQYVDTVMPSLMRIFAGGDEVVRFEPQEPGDEDASQQATDYCNWVWNQQNDGFVVMHHWFKDGLLNKIGVVKISWDDTPQTTRERYEGLTEAEFAAIQSDTDVEVGEVEQRPALGVGPDGMPAVETVYDCAITKVNREGRVRVDTVPPEEFLFGRRARNDRDADVLAHRTKKSRSDLVEMGYDPATVDGLFMGDDGVLLSERITRFKDIDDAPIRYQGPDDASHEVEVIEAYLRLDVNDDGIAEYVKVCYSGNTLLDVEEVDDHPFAIVSPILMPHRLAGLSMADQLMDIQLIKTTVQRQILDNLYLSNAPQIGAVDGQVNLDDLLTRRPGGIVRMKSPTSIVPIPTPTLGQEPYAMLEYLDTAAEQRTGATRYNQGLDADSLNKTATGINIIQNAAAQRIELIARVYAETGVKRAFKRILALVCQHQQKKKVIRLRGQWVEMDPRAWRESMDLTVSVGLGTGNRDQIMAHMMALLNIDQQIIAMQGGAQGPLVRMENVYAKLRKLLEAAGLKGADTYYTDPGSPEGQKAMQQPPKPDPKMIEAQAKMQMAQAEAQMRTQLAQQDAQNKAALARYEAEQQFALEAWKAEQQAALEQQKMQAAQDMAVVKFNADAEARLTDTLTKRQVEMASAMREPIEGRVDQTAEALTQRVDQLGEALAQVARAQAEQAAALADVARLAKAPRRLIRDENGRPVGAEVVQ